MPGGRAAAASRLAAEGAQLLAATFEKTRSITDLSIALNYTYQTLMPAARGRVTIDWSRLETRVQAAERRVRAHAHRHVDDVVPRHPDLELADLCRTATTSCARSTTSCVEKQVIKVEFDELVADERVAKIREAFFQFFLNNMTRAGEERAAAAAGRPGEGSVAEHQVRQPLHVQADVDQARVRAARPDLQPRTTAWRCAGRTRSSATSRAGTTRVEEQPEVRRRRQPERPVLPAPRHQLHRRSRRQGHVRAGGQLRHRQRAQAAQHGQSVRGSRHDRREAPQGEGRHRDGHLRARRGQRNPTPTSTSRSGACAADASSRANPRVGEGQLGGRDAVAARRRSARWRWRATSTR